MFRQSNFEQRGSSDRRRLPQLLQYLRRHVTIDLHDGECSRLIAAQRHARDVDSRFAENGSNAANHAGRIIVRDGDEASFELRLDLDAIRVRSAEARCCAPGSRTLPPVRLAPDKRRANSIRRAASSGTNFLHQNAARIGHGLRVDDVHRLIAAQLKNRSHQRAAE